MLYQTLSDAIEAAKAEAVASRVELLGDIEFEPMQYDTTQRRSYPIETIRGKSTRKFFHVIITRLSGPYELVAYAN